MDKKAKMREWYSRNKERVLAEKKAYYLANADSISLTKKRHYEKNKDKIVAQNLAYINKRSKVDPEYRLSRRLRARLNLAVRNNYIGGKAVSELGCSIAYFKQYLESLFVDGMSWDNYGPKGWHIDHIKPLSQFDLSNEDELKQACHYTNLRPLWWQENLRKSSNELQRT